MITRSGLTLGLLSCLGSLCPAQTSPGDVDTVVSVGLASGGLGGTLEPGDDFGAALTSLGDLDGDGVPELVVGAPGDDDGGPQHGAAWVLFAAPDGSIASSQKISETSGGLSGPLNNNGAFGFALASPGDLDGDGLPDLAVGHPRDKTAGPKHGSVWTLLLDADGSVRQELRITQGSGGFAGQLDNADEFGRAVAAVGDLDGDGIGDLAVGAPNDDDGAPQSGAVWLLLMDADGSVRDEFKISNTSGGFPGQLGNNAHFGQALAPLGDLDGNGVPDLLVVAPGNGSGTPDLWVLRLDADGTVQSSNLLTAPAQPFSAAPDLAQALGVEPGDGFGQAVGSAGDLDGNGVADLLVGAPGDDDGGPDRGAVYLLFLDAGGQLRDWLKYSSTPDGPFADLADGAGLGSSVGSGGDLDLDGYPDLLLGDAAGNLALVLLVNPFGSEPYVPAATVEAGRPGRASLVPPDPDAPSFEDFIDEPAVVVPNRTSASLTLRVGTSNNGEQVEFPGEQQFPVGDGPSDTSSGNFIDGLGLVGTLSDVVVANRDGDSISFLAGLAGTLAPHVETSLLPQNSAPVALANADYDGDGFLDVAVAGAQGVTVLLGDGLGGFPTRTFTPLELLTDLASADLDGDGIPDLVTSAGRAVTPALPFEEGSATVLLGLGDGSFAVASSFASGTARASVLLGDVDGDGLTDALLAGHQFDGGPGGLPQGTLELWSGDGLGGFAPSTAFGGFASVSAQGIHPTFGALEDLDGDGGLDAVYTSNDSIAHPLGSFDAEQPPVVLTVLRNDGAGGFDVSEIGTAYTGKGVEPILADIFLDDDGLPDAILVWYEDSDAGLGGGSGDDGINTFVTAFSADGEGGFFDPAANQFSVGDEPTDGRLADVDTGGDGRQDVIVPNLRDDSVSVLLGDGEGGVRSALTLRQVGPYAETDLPLGDWLGGPRAVEVADLGGDGQGDLVVYSAWTDLTPLTPLTEPFASLSVIDGASTSVIQHVLLDRAGELALGDVTADGLADAVVTQRIGAGAVEGLVVHRALGDGTLATSPLVIPAPAGLLLAGGLALEDLTGDGRAEIVTVLRDPGAGSGQLFVVDLSGGGVSTSLSPLGDDPGPVRSLVLGDLDGDGAADAAVAGAAGSLALALGLGLGGGLFGPSPVDPLAAAGGGGALGLGDVDGDGRPDLIVSTATEDGAVDQATVRLLLNQGGGQFLVQDVDALQSSGVLGALRPLLADMNGDEALDLVLVHGTADTVSILLNQLARFESFGAGKAGSGGLVPDLDGTGFTTPGSTFELRLRGGLGGAPTLLLVGLGELPAGPVLLESLLLQLVLPLGGSPGVPGQGALDLPLTIPALPELVGLELGFQALIQDAGAGAPAPTSLSWTNGLRMTVVP